MKLRETLFAPWLITPEAMRSLSARAQAWSGQLDGLPEPQENPRFTLQDGIAVVPITGPMMRRPDLIESFLFGATCTESLAEALMECSRRDDVRAVFLDIDSPGGTVEGTPELAHAVAEVSKHKYIYAFTGGQLCSAAYWVASQCDAIYASPGARVGSIGVILPVLDESAAYEKEGLKVEVFSAGKFKAAGLPGTALSEEQRAWLQRDVEEIAQEFKSAVLARGRKIPEEAMEGQTFSAKTAQRMNLAGMVANREEAMARLRSLQSVLVDTGARGMNLEAQLEQATAKILQLEQDAAARETLLSEASQQTLEIASLATERDRLKADLATAKRSLESLASKNSELESREQEIARRASLEAARIVAETGTGTPAQITPKGNAQTLDLSEKFKAITCPKEQSRFWQTLTPAQKAVLLNNQ